MVVSRQHQLLDSRYAKVEASYCCYAQRALSSELASVSYPVQQLTFASASFIMLFPTIRVSMSAYIALSGSGSFLELRKSAHPLHHYLLNNMLNFCCLYDLGGIKLAVVASSAHRKVKFKYAFFVTCNDFVSTSVYCDERLHVSLFERSDQSIVAERGAQSV
jgi:hypothetical protein